MNRTTSGASSRNKIHIVNHVRTVVESLQARDSNNRLINVLEIASGSGEHANFFATEIAGILYQPTEPDVDMHSSIVQYSHQIPSILPPLALNVLEYDSESDFPATTLAEPFTPGKVDLIICINMIHISPFSCTRSLMKLAALYLAPGGYLMLYGPFRVSGFMVESNIAFDESLRQRNPSWGVRDLEEVCTLAMENGLTLDSTHEMPANNLTVIFKK